MTDPTPSVSESMDRAEAVMSQAGRDAEFDVIRAHIDNLQRELAEARSIALAIQDERIARQAAESALADARRDAAAKQARIDELMLEYCPDEMTNEQREEWARHQVAFKEIPPK